MQKSLIILKHDTVSRGIIGEIIHRFERLGLKICAFKLIDASITQGENHYPSSIEWLETVGKRTLDDYKVKGYNPIEKIGTDKAEEIGRKIKNWNIDYLTAGPILVMILEGNNAIQLIRKHLGATNPSFANPGTIRGDYGIDSIELANEQGRPVYNLIHASGSDEEAKEEINLWFKKDEIFEEYDIATNKVTGKYGNINRFKKIL